MESLQGQPLSKAFACGYNMYEVKGEKVEIA
jgi:hypothetical protein